MPRSGAARVPDNSWMKRGTTTLIQTILPEFIEPDNNLVTSVFGFEDLCSYNWQDGGKVIIVPGGARKWSPLPLPITLSIDSTPKDTPRKPSHVPQYPFEPVFQALSIMNPNTLFDNVDIVVNRNSLRKLFEFAKDKRQDPFCMGLDMVQNTLFVSRREKHNSRIIRGSPNSGYGHSFEQTFTESLPGLENSTSHHRIIRYRIGSVDCVVRFEVDAYLDEAEDEDVPIEPISQNTDITTGMGNLAIDEAPRKMIPKGHTKAILGGKRLSSSTMAEIKSIQHPKKLQVQKHTPQLWFGRTPYLIVGKHDEGAVQSAPEVRTVETNCMQWELENQDALRKLAGLLARLKQAVLSTQGKAARLVCEDKGKTLQVFESKDGIGALPSEIIGKFWGVGNGGEVSLAKK